mgnify:CR=1 FL=1
MRSIHDYQVYIFDCDGVILDSNQLKIDAMERVLSALSYECSTIKSFLEYFANNFGKSRFHHVDVFIEQFLGLDLGAEEVCRANILQLFSHQCKALYLDAQLTPGFIDFILSLKGNKYIASGSEQSELREVFRIRGLEKYFTGIYGSPTAKYKLVETILSKEKTKIAVMFGDAISDLEAAQKNNINFIAYTPFSNVKNELIVSSNKYNQITTNAWGDIK